MLQFNIEELIRFSSEVFLSGKPNLIFQSTDFYTDTREISESTYGVFIAIKGKYYDSHEFLYDVINKNIQVIYVNLKDYEKYKKELLNKKKIIFGY